MSVLEWRGGMPAVLRESFDTTGREVILGANQRALSENGRRGPITCKWLWIRAITGVAHIFFNEADFTADTNYLTLDSTTTPPEIFSAPVEAESVWVQGSGAASIVELVALARRG